MADNLKPANMNVDSSTANAPIAFDDVAGVLVQRVKMGHGADGTFTDVTAATPLPITAAVLPLPAGSATAAAQATGNASLATIAANTPAPVARTSTLINVAASVSASIAAGARRVAFANPSGVPVTVAGGSLPPGTSVLFEAPPPDTLSAIAYATPAAGALIIAEIR